MKQAPAPKHRPAVGIRQLHKLMYLKDGANFTQPKGGAVASLTRRWP